MSEGKSDGSMELIVKRKKALRLTIDLVYASRCCFRRGYTGIVQTELIVERPQARRFQPKSNNADFVSKSALLGGGEGGIRTLETLLTPTRFPVARPRPS